MTWADNGQRVLWLKFVGRGSRRRIVASVPATLVRWDKKATIRPDGGGRLYAVSLDSVVRNPPVVLTLPVVSLEECRPIDCA